MRFASIFFLLLISSCASTSYTKKMFQEDVYNAFAASSFHQCENSQGKYTCEDYPPKLQPSFEDYEQERNKISQSSR